MDDLRLFVALDFPEAVKVDIKVLQNELQKSGADLGLFPSNGEPRVLWIGIGGQNNLLVSLAR